MNQLTEYFLKQKAMKMFILCFFGIPLYLWLFSIIFQLDKRTGNSSNSLKKISIIVLSLYPIVYFIIYTMIFYNLLGGNEFYPLIEIMPFHLIAMLCTLILLIIAAKSYVNYEKQLSEKTYDFINVFFLMWAFIFGIWKLQPNLNKYVTIKNTIANNG